MRQSSPFTLCVGSAMVIVSLLAGCETRKTIYRKVPMYYAEAGVTEGEYIDDEGNRVVIQYDRPSGVEQREKSVATSADLRNEDPDGRTTLSAILPEHVILHLQQCLLDEDYELIWDQLLASETKAAYEDEEVGKAEFRRWCERNRNDLYPMLNRLSASIRSPEVMVSQQGKQMRVEFHPTIGSQFEFTMLDLVYEGQGLKLVMAR